jgi:hypothetical protein
MLRGDRSFDLTFHSRKINPLLRTAFLACLLLVMSACDSGSNGSTGGSTYAGEVCVPDVTNQFFAFKHHGEALGFSYGVGEEPRLQTDHYQAIVRYNHPVNGTPYLFLTTGPDDDEGGDLLAVRMSSRDNNSEWTRECTIFILTPEEVCLVEPICLTIIM